MTDDVFISYAREDVAAAREVKDYLAARGFCVWLDVDEILPGERWRAAIERALAQASFVLVCLSTRSVGKRGFVQRELKIALDALQETLDEDIYLVPVRFDDCEIPRQLKDIQYIDLFEEGGAERLLKALEVGLDRRARTESRDKADPVLRLEEPAPAIDAGSLPAIELADLGGGGFIQRFAGLKRVASGNS